MSTQFESYIKEIKEAFIAKEIESAEIKLDEAKVALSNFTEEEAEANTAVIAKFHRLSMSFLRDFVKNRSADDTHNDKVYHLRALEKLGMAEVDDYLRLSANQEKYDVTLFEKILLTKPEHPQLIRDLGKYYLHKQQYENALICLKRAMDLCPEDLSTTSSLYECCYLYAEHLQAKEELDAEQLEKILMLYTEMHDGAACLNILNSNLGNRLPANVKENYLAISYYRTNDSQQALNLWNKLYKEDRLSAKSIIAYAEFSMINHDYAIATDLLEGTLGHRKAALPQADTIEDLLSGWGEDDSNNLCDTLHSYALLGSIQSQFGATDNAEELLKEGLNLKPNDTELLLELAKLYVSQEKMDEAVVQLNLARKAGLKEPRYLVEMAEIYFRIAEWGKTLELINQYHSIDVATSLSTYLGGVAASYLGNKSDAYHLLTLCINGFYLHHYRSDALYHRATLSRSVFRFQEAIEDVKEALAYNTNEGEFYRRLELLRGDLLFNLGQYEQSFDCLARAHQQSPLRGQMLLYLQVLVDSKYLEGKEVPDNIPALSNESIIQHPKDALDDVYNAKVYSILGQHINSAECFVAAAEAGYLPEVHYKKAFNLAVKAEAFTFVIELYHQMNEKFILDFNTTANYAFALYKSERYEETIPAYEEMAYRYPEMMESTEKAKIWSHTIAHCYQMLGRYDEAIQYYSILLSGMKIYDRGFVKRLQEIAEQRPDTNDFSRYSLLQYMKFANIALNEAEEESLKNLERQMTEIRYVV
ncbi:tetratricopeptide repeat protein [Bizionia sp.]|uniref:tetratricopeptide repeat protein n=1 Tax=Bizionia sp. TaxID=1954480 RepID=UPI003A906D82